MTSDKLLQRLVTVSELSTSQVERRKKIRDLDALSVYVGSIAHGQHTCLFLTEKFVVVK